ncbi:hypothetical protein [Polaromonas eurypsychrophila]|nr:hypothetical protein [Polaromonas eurypsychrophila]
MFFIATGVYAQPVIKDGFPCVSELCVGDGLQELRGIKWKSVKDQGRNFSASELDDVRKSLRGSISAAAATAIAKGVFDGSTLDALSGITGSCKSERAYVQGSFTSNAGSLTDVTLVLLSANGTQRWTVAHIRRFIDVPNGEAAKELSRQLEERYAGFDRPSQRTPKTRGSFQVKYGGGTYISYDLDYTSAEFNSFEKKNISPASCLSGLKAD